jgi:hypothetical protein
MTDDGEFHAFAKRLFRAAHIVEFLFGERAIIRRYHIHSVIFCGFSPANYRAGNWTWFFNRSNPARSPTNSLQKEINGLSATVWRDCREQCRNVVK